MSARRGERRQVPLKTILQHFLATIEDKQTASLDHYEQEFQDLKKFSETLKYSCTEGEKETNKKKNRYKDILPFDVTRVVLSCGSDYINANYIKGASGSPAYIASQGPLPNTTADFWRMIVQCHVQVIVMACNPHEAGKHKCENYWVEKEGETKNFGCVEIRLIKASNVCSDFLVRTMLITYINENGVKESRTVCQFHYLAWPDHGVPTMVRPLLDMVRLVRDTQASETLPVLVHCSAGCGRTGTICAIDFVWGLLRLGKMCEDFNLFDLVREMRRQRVAMVQTKEQYMLVHQAVGELLKQQLQLIQSHHYENLDGNGEPLAWQTPEANLYETIGPPNQKGEQIEGNNTAVTKTAHIPDNTPNSSKVSDNMVPSHLDKFKNEPHSEKSSEFLKESGEEKQDRNKVDYEEVPAAAPIPRSTPPLPKKKWSSPLSSKQEKEVENLTQKNRRAALKPIILPEESPDNSLKRRPKIAKLRALFERSSPNSEKKSTKSKTSISRSHSLGPVRKPSVTELFKSTESPVVEKSQRSEPAVRSGGKLKIPKLAAAPTVRTVPQVKRSKSLILNKQTTPFLSLLKEATGDAMFATENESNLPNQHGMEKRAAAKSDSTPGYFEPNDSFRPIYQRRRSFDSLTGEEDKMTWRNAVEDTPQRPMKPKAGMSLRQQLQMLTTASHRTVTSLASGWSLGIRERRNSFRQAISKDIDQFGSEGRFVYVSEDAAAGVLVDGHTPSPKHSHLTVRAQNGDILPPRSTQWNPPSSSSQPPRDGSERSHAKVTRTGVERPRTSDGRQYRMSSQSMRLPSNNKFLYRLRNELETKATDRQHDLERKYNFPEQKASISRDFETPRRIPDRDQIRRDVAGSSSKHEGDEKRRRTDGSTQQKHSGAAENIQRTSQQGLFLKLVESDVTDGIRKPYQSQTLSSKPRGSATRTRYHYEMGQNRTLPPHMTSRVFPTPNHIPSKSSSASSQSSDNVSDYVKLSPSFEKTKYSQEMLKRSVDSGNYSDISRTAAAQNRRIVVDKARDARSIANSKDSNNSSGRGMLEVSTVPENDKQAIYGRRIYLMERDGSESSGSSGARELHRVLSPRVSESSWAALTRSKSSSDALADFSKTVSAPAPAKPNAPPRVRRRSSTATLGPPQPLAPAARHSSAQLMDWRQAASPTEANSVGVDLDAVAASMATCSISEPFVDSSSQNPLTSRMQHYL